MTGSRGEWGYIRPVLREVKARAGVEYHLVVTNLHLLPEFGYSVEEIEKEGFEIHDRLYMALDGYTPSSMSKSLGVFLLSISDVFHRTKPDLVLLAGDRGEQLAAAIAGATMNTPVGHIQAGERSGNIDGLSRHAIARFAHLHFAANEDAAKRLRRAGEQEFRIHLTGAPQLDEIVHGEYASPAEVADTLDVILDQPLILLVNHPVTEEFGQAATQTRETLEAALSTGHQILAIFPNNDAGTSDIRRTLERYSCRRVRIERNLPRHLYLGLMRIADVMVGNSSSAIIEAPIFNLPAVNVGSRQRNRFRGPNVIDVSADRTAIREALERALDSGFREEVEKADENPYLGDGKVAERIVDVLADVEIDERLLKKQITY